MAIQLDRQTLDLLRQGKAPGRGELLHTLTCGAEFLTDFLAVHYLDSYIPEGGSKIKFLTGRPGAGKTHVMGLLLDEAEKRGFVTVSLSATEVWLHDFRELYLAVLRELDLEQLLRGCADEIVREMGYDPAEIPEGMRLIDLLAQRQAADALSKTEIRNLLRKRFAQNPLLDNCFAACCSLLTGDLLGHPALDAPSRELILSCLYGDKAAKITRLRSLGIAPSRITRFNARHLLRSLAELVHMSGAAGLVITVDDMERLLVRSTEYTIRYSKARREDAYESIRQLIDDIDSMKYLLFFLGFDRELIDNENSGLKSYQALWMRIQNEIVSSRMNRFADILDMDRLADQAYPPEVLCRMAEKLGAVLSENGVPAGRLTPEQAAELADKALYGGLGLPYLVNQRVVMGGERDV